MFYCCVILILKKQEHGGVSAGLGDNARPPCKAWKWEEKEEGSVAAPASPPGGYREAGDGEGRRGVGIWRVSTEGKVDITKGKRQM